MDLSTLKVSRALTSEERNALPDSAFGLPDLRKFPLADAAHVRSALSYFHKCPPDRREELLRNINTAAKQHGVSTHAKVATSVLTGLAKVAWIENMAPNLIENEAGRRLVERIIRKTTRNTVKEKILVDKLPAQKEDGSTEPTEGPTLSVPVGAHRQPPAPTHVDLASENLPYGEWKGN